ncbi:hypothetical protein [Nocardia terpenica]|uniref:ParB/Sulfiredoxin domain-containing protein n=1 Tax=Nocardia terpenica TaxID=455432 RepID=A0A6G9YZL6_9NOCA|nr:hypothetical protein [Nocardia terpenica]QIS18561.1 hypothetical protein F6W96_09915 [Nocardia terpenica]
MALYPITDLHYYPGNARKGDHDLIEESLTRFGQYRPVVVNRGTHSAKKRTNVILVGNNTVHVARERLGWNEIDVHWVDVDDDTAHRINLVDNRANDKSGYDSQALLDSLHELPDLHATGYDTSDLDRLLESLETKPDDALDEAPVPSAGVISYNLIFDNEAQQREWFEFTRWLRRTYKDMDTLAERLTEYLQATKKERE